MPKLQDYRDTYYEFSGLASSVNRQLALAGIALIWLFKLDVGGTPTLPHELLLPAILIGAALALDLLQYCLGALIWYCYYQWLEHKRVSATEEQKHSPWLERPISLLLAVKIVLTVIAYCLLLSFLWTKLAATQPPVQQSVQSLSVDGADTEIRRAGN